LTQQTRAVFQAAVDVDLASGAQNTAAELRTALANLSDSAVFPEDSVPFAGQVSFTGSTNPGLKVASHTSTTRDALTGEVGMIIWNTTTEQYEAYDGSDWTSAFIGESGEEIAATLAAYLNGTDQVVVLNESGDMATVDYVSAPTDTDVFWTQSALGVLAFVDYAGVRTLINVEDAADVTDATNVAAAGAVMASTYNANTILAATSDNTPAAVTIAEQRLVGRITSGAIDDLTAAQANTILFDGMAGIMSVTGGLVTASVNPAVTTIELGHASDTTLSRSAAGLIAVEGVILAPHLRQNSQSAAYTLVLGDANSHIYHPGADTTPRIWTIPANASVAFPIGTFVTFINDTSGGAITVAITTDTMILGGAGTTGSRTLAANGIATAVKMTATRWIISGTGLT
jgi:hypothetical protein